MLQLSSERIAECAQKVPCHDVIIIGFQSSAPKTEAKQAWFQVERYARVTEEVLNAYRSI